MIFFSAPIYSGKYNARNKKCKWCLIMVILSILMTGCNSRKDEPLTIGVAASLTSVMEELAPMFQEETGLELKVSYASSGTLQNQIRAGAPLDIFISASKSKMDELASENRIEDMTNLLRNRVFFVVNKEYSEEIKTINDLISTDYKIAIGEPDSVPAGRYSKEILKSLELWDQLENHFVYGKNVRQVVDYINSGEVSSGFIYKTDLVVLKEGQSNYLMSEDLHTPIIYPIGMVSESKNKESARLFYKFLEKESSIELFEKYEFEFIN